MQIGGGDLWDRREAWLGGYIHETLEAWREFSKRSINYLIIVLILISRSLSEFELDQWWSSQDRWSNWSGSGFFRISRLLFQYWKKKGKLVSISEQFELKASHWRISIHVGCTWHNNTAGCNNVRCCAIHFHEIGSTKEDALIVEKRPTLGGVVKLKSCR